ncbi:MAG: stage 0 sporulation protein [Lentisphaerae bacterium]|nr:stage 0 sporulation protein [Lentisphaerota bacterium]
MHRRAYVQVEGGSEIACYCPEDLAIHEGDECVIRDQGLLEYGTVARIEKTDRPPSNDEVPTVLRQATLQDQSKARENALMSKMALESCIKSASEGNLDISLVRVYYNFDRSQLHVFYTSDERVDFRNMIRDLSAELKTRIEMKQIGVRDEAGIIGGMGPCGRKMCCCTWLHHFDSINVRMAKVQNLSLNPNAISGMCGRLKCCLRYEFSQYRDLEGTLPGEGVMVRCPSGKGCVVGRDLIARKVKVRLEDDRLLQVDGDDLEKA